jgi:hypothetical protein
MGNRKPPKSAGPHPLPGIYGKKAVIRYFEKEEGRARPGALKPCGNCRRKCQSAGSFRFTPGRLQEIGLIVAPMDYPQAGSALHGPGGNTAAEKEP